jgi:hypothetical protein
MTPELAVNPNSYEIADPDLNAWASRHRLQVNILYRDDPVRSVWITGPNGKAQIWLGWPISIERIEIHAAKLELSIPEKWSSRVDRNVSLSELADALEEVFHVTSRWIA